jgi:hypothetical protein
LSVDAKSYAIVQDCAASEIADASAPTLEAGACGIAIIY